MESLDPKFEMAKDVVVHIEADGESIRVSEGEDRVWMQTTSAGNEVSLEIFAQNIPTDIIGEVEASAETTKYKIFCETTEKASTCKRFWASFMDTGYGKRWRSGEAFWSFGLDLKDVTEVLSEKMFYHAFSFEGAGVEEEIEKMRFVSGIHHPQGVLMCVYCDAFGEDIVEKYEALLTKLSEDLLIDCRLVQQLVCDKTLQSEATVHVIYH